MKILMKKWNNNWKSFILKLDVVNNFLNTLHHIYEKHENYNSLTINNVLHLLVYDPNKNPCLVNVTCYFSSDKKKDFLLQCTLCKWNDLGGM